MKITKNIAMVILAAILFAIGLLAYLGSQRAPPLGILGELHEHADFKVYLEGAQFNFTNEKYMSEEDDSRSGFIHLHNMDGNVMHKHISGIRLADFFESIGMVFNSTCFVADENRAYCNQGGKTLKFFVNGVPNQMHGEYEIRDLDKLLISYGNEDAGAIGSQLSSITDNSCIYSKKCPERGPPPDESTCSTGENCAAVGS